MSDAEAAPVPPVRRPGALLAAIRDGEAAEPHLAALAGCDEADLARLREDRPTALAFWLNAYNAGAQLLLDRRPGLYDSRLRGLRFFRTPCLTVAGTELSLDDVEHGLIRGSRSKYGLGYLPRLGPSSFERRFRLAEADPRIHFAVNCGAASCPAVRRYAPDSVDETLDAATRAYLDRTVEHDPAAGVLRVPRLCLWYRGDFGGTAGLRGFLRTHGALPEGTEPSISYRSWDWSMVPEKFAAGE